jgi:hypothetical protein
MNNTALFLIVGAGILLAAAGETGTSGSGSSNNALPAGGGPSVLAGKDYPVGTIFYNPTTGAPAAFVGDYAPYGNTEVPISLWNQFNPGKPLPPYEIL